MKEKLTRIVNETEQFVRSCERPGVVKRWKKMNPDIIFLIVRLNCWKTTRICIKK